MRSFQPLTAIRFSSAKLIGSWLPWVWLGLIIVYGGLGAIVMGRWPLLVDNAGTYTILFLAIIATHLSVSDDHPTNFIPLRLLIIASVILMYFPIRMVAEEAIICVPIRDDQMADIHTCRDNDRTGLEAVIEACSKVNHQSPASGLCPGVKGSLVLFNFINWSWILINLVTVALVGAVTLEESTRLSKIAELIDNRDNYVRDGLDLCVDMAVVEMSKSEPDFKQISRSMESMRKTLTRVLTGRENLTSTERSVRKMYTTPHSLV